MANLKYYVVSLMLVFSSFTVGCSEPKEDQKRSEQKGNGLDSFDPEKTKAERESKDKAERKAHNGLDSFQEKQ